MKIPRNGTLVANTIFLLTGVVLGAVGTWTGIRTGLFHTPSSALSPQPGVAGDAPRPANDDQGGRSDTPTLTAGPQRATLSLSSALRIRDPATRSEVLRRLGAEAAEENIANSLRDGLTITRTQDRLDYYRGLVGNWSERDPEAALNHVQHDIAPGLVQSELISLAVNKWGADDPRDAWTWTENHLSGPLREQSQADLMIGWTRRNPVLAATWLRDSGLQSRLLLTSVGTTWAEQDPESAAEWAAGLPQATASQAAQIAVAAEWTRQDAPMAADYFAPDILESGNIELATIIADIWGTTDPAATALWVDSLPKSKVRDQAAGTLASIWATRDIEGAVAWSATIEDATTRAQVVSHLGTTWGAMDPDNAISWLSTLPIDEAEVGLVGAFNSWAAVEPHGMHDWIQNAEPSPISDLGRKSLADVISQDDILTSLELAMGISSPTERVDAVSRYFRHWRKIDDLSAREWYQAVESSFPPDLKERLNRDLTARLVPAP